MTQTTLNATTNKNLFSIHYLENNLKQRPEWSLDAHTKAFQEIKNLYGILTKTDSEKQLEHSFFEPIFKVLNHTFEVDVVTDSGGRIDFVFFPDQKTLEDAKKAKDKNAFFDKASVICEVKKWGIDIDTEKRYVGPGSQLRSYLDDTGKKWGILTNGIKWRLYCKDKGKKDYYEIDLQELVDKNDIEGFKYFYYFFGKDSFTPSAKGVILIEEILKGSSNYTKGVGKDLKNNVYKAMQILGTGYIECKRNNLDMQNESTRASVKDNTMILLYRFLFLLYAEGKGLLDLGNKNYREKYSFDSIKKEIASKHGSLNQEYSPNDNFLLQKLKKLFKLINLGSMNCGYNPNDLQIPAYNGGLFDPKMHQVDAWQIGDTFLAKAVDLLSRSNWDGNGLAFVDYADLEIRHLGSIYEGLLEYNLQVASEDMVLVKDKWIPLREYNENKEKKKALTNFDEFDRAITGHLYISTDNGERKSTGSYYTPEYIVDYIIKNTLTPVVKDKLSVAEKSKKHCADAIREIKVLDPAMGSGHFLVTAIDFLADELLTSVKMDIDSGKTIDDPKYTLDWASREVASHCIYGVDLNPLAVELAKVSVWLSTISKDKPLSFLDHRLKQGNSLIGARLQDLKYYPGAKKKEKGQTTLPSFISPLFITHLIGKVAELEKIGDDHLEDIKRKEKAFEEFKHLPEYRKAKALANIYTGVYFGNEVTPTQNKGSANIYYDLFWAIMGDENEWHRKTNRDWFERAEKIAQERSFFHWELEFPEIFFEGGSPKENPGWDAVVGNPPYVNAISLNKTLSEYEKPFWKQVFKSASGAYDLYILFIELAIKLTRKQRLLSLITPNKFLSAPYAIAFREYFCQNAKLLQVLNLSRIHVFEDPSVYPIVTVVENASPTDNYEISIEIPTDTQNPSESRALIQNSENLTKLPENIWGFLISENLPLILKAEQISVQLQRCSTVRASSTAAESDTYEDALTDIEGVNRKKFINTGLIDRYDTLWGIDSLRACLKIPPSCF